MVFLSTQESFPACVQFMYHQMCVPVCLLQGRLCWWGKSRHTGSSTLQHTCLRIETVCDLILRRIARNMRMQTPHKIICFVLLWKHGVATDLILTSHQRKHWVSYIHAMLMNSDMQHVKKYSSTVSLLHTMSNDVSIEKFTKHKLFEFKDTPCISEEMYRKETLTCLLCSIVMQAVEKNTCLLFLNWREQIVDHFIHLQRNLQLQITIHSLNIHNTHIHECFPHIMIHSRGQFYARGFEFCGIRNNFVVFVPHKNVIFRANYTHTVEFYVNSTFDIRAVGEIATLAAHRNVEQVVSHFFVATRMGAATQYTALVHTLASRIILVNVTMVSKGIPVFLYDGPGLKSSKHTITKSQFLFTASSYQCILQTFATIVVRFGSFLLHRHNALIIANPTMIKFLMNATNQERKFFQSAENKTKFLNISISHINISNTQSNIKGPQTSVCRFGGVWFYEYNTSAFHTKKYSYRPKQLLSMCSPISRENISIQNVYSATDSILLIACSYEWYSIIAMSLHISIVSCQPRVIDVCSVMFKQEYGEGFDFARTMQAEADADPYECMVIQLVSRSMYRSVRHRQQCLMLVSLHKENTDVEYRYAFRGFLSDVYLRSFASHHDTRCPVYVQNQFIMVGGDNYCKDKGFVSVRMQKDGKYIPVSNRTTQCILNTNKVDWRKSIFYKMTGSQPFLDVNPTNTKSILFNFLFFALMPTTDLKLRFLYQPLSVESWLELVFSQVDRKTPKCPLHMISLSNTWKTIGHLFRKKIMEAHNLTHEEFSIEIKAEMKVRHLFRF